MPPNADALRQRRGGNEELSGFDGDDVIGYVGQPETTARAEVTKRLKDLKTTEVCIDGIVYDIESFDHPGGESIFVFGGNDVTVQYKMIHPYHTSKHLEKMKRVGKVSDYKAEYAFDTPFEREIKREVFKIVNRGKEFGTVGWFFRAFMYTCFFFYLQYLWLSQGTSWALAVVYGVSQALIGTNVQHDANHGACSKKYPWINNLLGLGADFIGGSKWLWLEQHWTHHAYTNHASKDPDSFGAEPMMLFNDYPPNHPARTFVHSFQAFYYPIVLAGYWVSSVFNPEVLDLRQRGAQSIGFQMESDYLKARRKYAIMLRLLYIFINVVCPFLYHDVHDHGGVWAVVGHILLMGVSESLALAVLFSLSHNFVNADRDPTGEVAMKLAADSAAKDGKNPASSSDNAAPKGGQPVCWYKSQVETSCTYGGFISGCLTGGLNFQIEHHLFPRMSSAWYPYIAPKVREVCKKHGVHYEYYPWVLQNLVSTITYMHAAGTGSNWKDNNPLSGKL